MYLGGPNNYGLDGLMFNNIPAISEEDIYLRSYQGHGHCLYRGRTPPLLLPQG